MKRFTNKAGYGQVEPNHLSAQRTGQIYAQLPAASSISVLENGMFVKYDYANNEVNFTGEGEWMLVFNEVKLYDDDHRYYTDKSGLYAGYAMKTSDFVDGVMVPRVFKTNVGDIMTTNCVRGLPSEDAANVKYFAVANDGYLTMANDASAEMVWKVVKLYTMPDGQAGFKLQRIK